MDSQARQSQTLIVRVDPESLKREVTLPVNEAKGQVGEVQVTCSFPIAPLSSALNTVVGVDFTLKAPLGSRSIPTIIPSPELESLVGVSSAPTLLLVIGATISPEFGMEYEFLSSDRLFKNRSVLQAPILLLKPQSTNMRSYFVLMLRFEMGLLFRSPSLFNLLRCSPFLYFF